MKIDVTEVTDEGVVTLDLDDEATKFLIETGFNSILSNAVEEWKTKLNLKLTLMSFGNIIAGLKKMLCHLKKVVHATGVE